MNRPTAKEWGASFALFTLLTVAMTWPFAARLRVMDAGDSAFFTWAVGWQLHALKTDPASLPHGNFYAPSRFTFFMDEPVLGTGLLALPLSLFTDDAILLMNVVRLLTFVLTGVFTWRLARDLGQDQGAALAAGGFFAFSPIRMDQVAHLSTLGTQWIPVVFLFALRYCLNPNVTDGVRTGVAFALSFLACGYHGLFFAILLPLCLIPFLFSLRTKEILLKAWIPIAAASVFLYPLYSLSRSALGPIRFERSAGDTLKYAASVETFFAASVWNRTWGGLTEPFRGDPNNLFPGLVVLSLALVSLVRVRTRQAPWPRFHFVLVILAAGAALLALGPVIRFQGVDLAPGPYSLLRDHVAVYSNIRATSRAGIFMAFALALLAGFALSRSRRTLLFPLVALAAFLVEARIAPIPAPESLTVVDSREPVPAVYQWLKRQPPQTVIAELPARLASDYTRPAFHDSVYMVWSTRHWQRLVNGFAGAETPMITRFRATMPFFPEPTALAVLKEAQVRYVVLHLRGYGPNQRNQIQLRLGEIQDQVREVKRFVNDVKRDVDVDVVYELIDSGR